MESQNVQPFTDCPALDGCHCQTNSLAEISEIIEDSGRQFSETGKLFKDYERSYDMDDHIRHVNDRLNDIANMETVAYKQLLKALPPE